MKLLKEINLLFSFYFLSFSIATPTPDLPWQVVGERKREKERGSKEKKNKKKKKIS